MQTHLSDEKLIRLREKRRQLTAKLDKQIKQQQAKAKAERRKTDARKKIIAGGIVLKMIQNGEIDKQLILSKVEERDRSLFEDRATITARAINDAVAGNTTRTTLEEQRAVLRGEVD